MQLTKKETEQNEKFQSKLKDGCDKRQAMTTR